MDLLSELKALPSCDVSRYGISEYYDGGGNVHGDYVNTDDVLDLVKKYGWHDVSEQPEKDGIYFVTTGNKIRVTKYWKQDNIWADTNVIAWMPMFDPYKKEE